MKRPQSPQPTSINSPPLAKRFRGNILSDNPINEPYCTILVQDKLFKLRKSLLTENSSVFAELLDQASNGNPNDVFIELEESAEECGALFWALSVSNPKKIAEELDNSRWVSIFLMAHKYEVAHCRSWAEKRIRNFDPTACRLLPIQQLEAILMVDAEGWATNIRSAWLSYLDQKDSALASKKALDFAERHDLRKLQGYIYYNELIRRNPAVCAYNPDQSSAYKFGNDFNAEQCKNLYQGFQSISKWWEGIKHIPKQTSQPDSKCGAVWAQMWSQGGLTKVVQCGKKRHPGSFYPPLRALAQLATSKAKGYNHIAKKAASVCHSELSRGMAEHFLGPLPADDRGSEGTRSISNFT